jgi:hypothetical protein
MPRMRGNGNSPGDANPRFRRYSLSPSAWLKRQRTMRDVPDDSVTAKAPRYTRRLSDKILIAFHHACDQGDVEVAEQLLHILEMMLTRRPLTPDGTRRRSMESLVTAHERLWQLRHPDSR